MLDVRASRRLSIWALIALFVTGMGCIYDPDEPCSPGEVFVDEGGNPGCFCEEGLGSSLRTDITVLTESPEGQRPREGCRPCRFNEVLDETTDTCRCGTDSVVNPAGECVPTFGTACTADPQCARLALFAGPPIAGVCRPVSAEASICTVECDGPGDERCSNLRPGATCTPTGFCVAGGR